MPRQSTNVFVSYSHADASLVAPLVKLLRVNQSLVFQDIDDIQPGKRWRTEIARGLAHSSLVVVFWCEHASRSDEVLTEWNTAIEQGKDLLPLLLDATPLPPQLGRFQWIDFRGTVGPNHSSIVSLAEDVRKRAPRSLSYGRRLLLARLAAVLVAAVGVSLVAIQDREAPIEVRPKDREAPIEVLPKHIPKPRPEHPPMVLAERAPLEPEPHWAPYSLVLLPLLLAAAGCLIWWLRRRLARRRASEVAKPHPHEVERRMASEIETEILRRTALRRDFRA